MAMLMFCDWCKAELPYKKRKLVVRKLEINSETETQGSDSITNQVEMRDDLCLDCSRLVIDLRVKIRRKMNRV